MELFIMQFPSAFRHFPLLGPKKIRESVRFDLSAIFATRQSLVRMMRVRTTTQDNYSDMTFLLHRRVHN
jgi:hypothetical protein